MRRKSTSARDEYNARLYKLGYEVATWAPGDGAVRYRIVRTGEQYHGPGEPLAGTALGWGQAEQQIRGFLAGADLAAAERRKLDHVYSHFTTQELAELEDGACGNW